MSLDVWFQKDIAQVLSALENANFDMACLCETHEARQYRQGYLGALTHVAKALGIPAKYLEPTKGSLSAGSYLISQPREADSRE